MVTRALSTILKRTRTRERETREGERLLLPSSEAFPSLSESSRLARGLFRNKKKVSLSARGYSEGPRMCCVRVHALRDSGERVWKRERRQTTRGGERALLTRRAQATRVSLPCKSSRCPASLGTKITTIAGSERARETERADSAPPGRTCAREAQSLSRYREL